MKKGAIFDWDGVIIDSARQHEQSWELLAREAGRELPEGHFRKGFGMKNELIIPNVLKWTADRNEISLLSMRKEQLYREVLVKEDLKPLPGVVEFLNWLSDLNIPMAIGSSTDRQNIDIMLQRLELSSFFSAIISGEDVESGKPDPEVFLLAARRIDCEPQHCVVFEDAPAGIAAAHNGNMKAVGVATTHPAYELTDADLVVHGLDEITRAHLEDLFFFANEPAS